MKKITLFFAFCAMYCMGIKVIFGQNTFPSAGNVGIGTTSPSALLDVVYGDARINGLTIGKGPNGTYSTALGYVTLYNNNSGINNTAVGSAAMYYNYNGSSNTAVGSIALYRNSSGNGNTAVGLSALYTNISGNNNTGLGAYALKWNNTGNYNSACGGYSLYNNDASYNSGFGYYSLQSNTTGQFNTGLGYNALVYSNTGNYNAAVGANAMQNNHGGSANAAVGYSSLMSSNNAYGNTAMGYASAGQVYDGTYNVGIGYYTLFTNTTGSYNTALGALSDIGFGTYSNATAIGSTALCDASNKVRIGNSSVSSNGGQVNWTAYSDARVKKDIRENVPGLEFINALRPVTYHYDVAKENAMLGIKDTSDWDGKYDIEKIAFTGFLAQDVQAAAEAIDYDFSGVDKSGNILGLRYAEFTVPLVKAVQELSAENTDLRSTVEQLQAENAVLNERLDRIEAMLSGNTSTLSVQGSATLAQNVPNPFTGTTQIAFFVPENISDASIMIHTMQGVELYAAHVESGNGSITFDGSRYDAGTYVCSLWIHGIQVKSILLQIAG